MLGNLSANTEEERRDALIEDASEAMRFCFEKDRNFHRAVST